MSEGKNKSPGKSPLQNIKMIAIGHSAVGVIIGTAAVRLINPQVPLAIQMLMVFIVSFAVHYAMDFLPHGHYYIDPKHLTKKSIYYLGLDLIGGIILFAGLAALKYGFTSTEFWLIIAAIAGSQATDALEALISLKLLPRWKWLQLQTNFHSRMHWHDEPDSPLPGGARPLRSSDIWQLAVIALAVLLLI